MAYKVSTPETAPFKGLQRAYVFDDSSSPHGTIPYSDWEWLIGQSKQLRTVEPQQLFRDSKTQAETIAKYPMTIFTRKSIPAEVEICHNHGYLSLLHSDDNERTYLVELAEHLNDVSKTQPRN